MSSKTIQSVGEGVKAPKEYGLESNMESLLLYCNSTKSRKCKHDYIVRFKVIIIPHIPSLHM
jgi:hypothetical protein